ncbi:hypothetical protein JI435_434280 [Parastagonospora nodorum SN15]|uniref:Uncharacterized protein n=1 Tax=Phaeosphaeria nodorum (strain SN15 / ATCC MYA-4574 / FGSC 10173) TaxID=321614 RepID=A0A7U2F1E9_PHANO|nr:hypothetical protein JI435_434280 [Parastagonospora nodorum SN15]
MPRKGTATVKKVDKYVWEDEYDDEPERERSPMSLDSPGLVDFGKSSALGRTINYGASDSENTMAPASLAKIPPPDKDN